MLVNNSRVINIVLYLKECTYSINSRFIFSSNM